MFFTQQEKQRIAHSQDGFCQVIGCPECEIRRQERLGGKILDKVRVEVVEGSETDFQLARLEAENRRLVVENTGLMESLAASRAIVEDLNLQLRDSMEARDVWFNIASDANERAQALGAEICGYVGAMLDLAEAPRGSEEMEEFLGLLANLALVKLHDTGHRLAPVQHD